MPLRKKLVKLSKLYQDALGEAQTHSTEAKDIDCENVHDASSDVGDDGGSVPPVYRTYSLLVELVAFKCIAGLVKMSMGFSQCILTAWQRRYT
mmetsp:Transcript_5648/g.6945  ORF Transcript_5648/g.6945 Transcript_5648/m.6945 type:complete len:93 (+) Transcript_5648:462-740(+)